MVCFDADIFAVDTGNPNHVHVYDYGEKYLGMMFYMKCDLYIIWKIGCIYALKFISIGITKYDRVLTV